MAITAVPDTRAEALHDLESRHDELLRLLCELENRVAKVLAEYQAPRQEEDARGTREITAKAA